MPTNKTALITGATAGFGEEIARKVASLGYQLIITGRRKERLQMLSKELEEKYKIKPVTLPFDIRDREACDTAISSLPHSHKHIDLLVNNAGLAAGADPFEQSLIDDFDRMIDTNIKGLIYITKRVVKDMIVHNRGHIVNISSIAGLEVYPNASVYCATKHAVNALTKGFRIDLVKHNIKVGSISPGMAETEFSIVRYHGDEAKAKAVYQGIIPLVAKDIAEALEFMITRPKHVNICDIQINPTQQANTYIRHQSEKV